MTVNPRPRLRSLLAAVPTRHQRRLIAVLVLGVLTLAATLLARVAGDDGASAARSESGRSTPHSGDDHRQPTESTEDAPHPGTDPVAAPPRTTDPQVYARSFAHELWNYDTRTADHARYAAGLLDWLSPDDSVADPASVRGAVPDARTWDRLKANQQRASATVSGSHIPTEFKQAMADDPAAITDSYVYAVTVTGKQSLRWRDGGAGGQGVAATLAVQCRPDRPCALAGIAPNVAP